LTEGIKLLYFKKYLIWLGSDSGVFKTLTYSKVTAMHPEFLLAFHPRIPELGPFTSVWCSNDKGNKCHAWL